MKNKNYFDSLLRDLDFTTENYGQMYKRLHAQDVLTRFFIVYYSVISILYGILPLYFEEYIKLRPLLDYITLSFSIVVLIASLLISFANYETRSKQVVVGLDQLKRLKKRIKAQIEVADFEQEGETITVKEAIKDYHDIVDKMELRTDVDYYHACHNLSMNNKHPEAWRQLSWSHKAEHYIFPVINFAFYILLFLAPWIMLLFIF